MEIERVKERVMEGRPGFTRQYGPARTDHQPGIPFWPQEIARDMVVIFFLVAILFFLSAFVTPFLGPARSIGVGEIIVPDWYLLFSWGLLKAADVLPQFQLGPAFFGSQLWGDLLSGIPVIALLLLPFLDRGRESRPAKAPIRSAVGLGAIVAIFTSSLYSVREIIGEIWHTPDIDPNPLVVKTLPLIPDGTLKLFLIVPPILVGLATFVGLRRLGFRPMRTALLAILPATFFVLAAIAAAMLFLPGGLPELSRPFALQIAVFLAIFVGTAGAGTLAALLLPETSARKGVLVAGVGGLTAFLAALWYASVSMRGDLSWVLLALYTNMNTVVLMPPFVILTAWFALRRPYSTYEYLLNECYQCGKCHTVCPVTKVEEDALGGLNLVYNTFKKQHDGVPLWTCLACDACSAVCPLDIQYSDYILAQRAGHMRRLAADGGEKE
ncbi:MAG: hypothetical protein A3K68_05795 [Euryarchaeota archaeon RBG_16_68_13]|nr:MAG: hypothetical protein A3K68_05795 [Euryarchaeota archaeon RBG_16_68_13]